MVEEVEADRRPDHPAVVVDFLGDDGITIVGFGQKAAEPVFQDNR
jgi:hypothetical protein